MEQIENTRKLNKALILAGGLGTRFLPATICLAKELFPIGNKPIMMYHLEDLIKAGITEVAIVGNKLKESSIRTFIDAPEEYLRKVESDGKMSMLEEYNKLLSQIKFTYLNQDDEEFYIDGQMVKNEAYGQRGSAIAVYVGKYWAKGEPFVVLNGDDLLSYSDGHSAAGEVVEIYKATGDNVIMGRECDKSLMYKYSSMKPGYAVANGRGFKMEDIIEKPAPGTEPSNIMGFARYVITDDFFDRVFKVKPRSNGEWNMTDVFQNLALDGKVSACIFDGDYYDCGSMSGYVLANVFVGLKDEKLKPEIEKGLEKLLNR